MRDNALAKACRGRPRKVFSNPLREKCLTMVAAGYGRVSSCRALGVAYDTFLRVLKDDPGFAASLREAERAQVQSAEKVLYDMIFCDERAVAIKAAVAYLARRDRSAAASKARAESREKSASDTLSELMKPIAGILYEFVPADRQEEFLVRLTAMAEAHDQLQARSGPGTSGGLVSLTDGRPHR